MPRFWTNHTLKCVENLGHPKVLNKTQRLFDFKGELDAYDFKWWNRVSCWKVGDLNELERKADNCGFIIDKKTATVLFPHDLNQLWEEKRIVTLDSRSIYDVDYEAYFQKNGNLFGVYAHMSD